MAIIADLTLFEDVTVPDCYITILAVEENLGPGYYCIGYFRRKGGAKIDLPADQCMMTFSDGVNRRIEGRLVKGVGAKFNRSVPARLQAYADLRAKVAAGHLPWLSNIRDDAEPPALEAALAAASVREAELLTRIAELEEAAAARPV